MKGEDEFRVRPGRIRHTRADRSMVGKILAAANKGGGQGPGLAMKRSTFGRGRSASLRAGLANGRGARSVVIKARVVKQAPKPGGLSRHVDYLQRDGVTKEGAPGRLFDAGGEEAKGAAFAERCGEDRHHFRFIVAPQDAEQLTDLKAFTRELMTQAEADVGTKLDWVAVDHWNTGHPHIHILVRGQTDQGEDLVISRDYIGTGLRARASELVTLELGPRTKLDIRRGLDAEVGASRWTGLDFGLARSANREGLVDLRPSPGRTDRLRAYRVERMRTLERFGVAEPQGVGRWRLARNAEATMRALGERDDIIARMHRAMGGERGAETLDLHGDLRAGPIIGRLVGRGLDDELKGSAFVVIDGVDGRLHHVRLGDLALATDAPMGGVVEARLAPPPPGGGEDGRTARVQLLVRADYDLQAQVQAKGATWLDRQLVARAPTLLAEGGFGAEVHEALQARATRLEGMGLAERAAGGVRFALGLLATLQQSELEAASARLAKTTGLVARTLAEGDSVSGVYRQRVTLASGRFAMIEDGLGFSLVPWRPDLEAQPGRQLAGVMAAGGRVDWTLGRSRGPSR